MPLGVEPLVINYSFVGSREQATDLVDLVALDAAFEQIADKLNEIVNALDVTLRDDNTLDDGCLEPRHMSDDFRAEVVSIVNQLVDPT
jgi:hypothetical protein